MPPWLPWPALPSLRPPAMAAARVSTRAGDDLPRLVQREFGRELAGGHESFEVDDDLTMKVCRSIPGDGPLAHGPDVLEPEPFRLGRVEKRVERLIAPSTGNCSGGGWVLEARARAGPVAEVAAGSWPALLRPNSSTGSSSSSSQSSSGWRARRTPCAGSRFGDRSSSGSASWEPSSLGRLATALPELGRPPPRRSAGGRHWYGRRGSFPPAPASGRCRPRGRAAWPFRRC